MFGFLGTVAAIRLLFSDNLSDTQLSFDVDSFIKIKDDAEAALNEIRALKTTLKTDVEQLKQDWNTNAGKYFFEHLDSDWETQVKRYESTLQAFCDVMDELVTTFEQIEEEANSIRIDLCDGSSIVF